MRVCFTNTTIKETDISTSKLDKCIIGFDNNWVNNNPIYPVIYYQEGDRLANVLREVMEQVDPITAQKLCQYCKQHSSPVCDNNASYLGDMPKLYRDNEHEWRYIPEGYSQEFLTFDPKDVFEIYVNNESQKELLENEFPIYKDKIKVLIDCSEL